MELCQGVCKKLLEPTCFNSLAKARHVFERCLGASRVLIFGEAQTLFQKEPSAGQIGETFEWLRAMSDTGGFDLVFCADLDLPRAIETMPQLQSRMMRSVVICSVSRKDVAAIVAGNRLSETAAINPLHAIARPNGGLRNVENVARLVPTGVGDQLPLLTALKAAILDMKLAPKGARS